MKCTVHDNITLRSHLNIHVWPRRAVRELPLHSDDFDNFQTDSKDDFEDFRNYRGVQKETHGRITSEWQKWLNHHPDATPKEIEDFADYIDKKYGDGYFGDDDNQNSNDSKQN